MAKGLSPTARTLKRLRDEGYTAEVVEKTIPRCFIKKDLYGLIDILAIRPGEILGVQATSRSNHAARRTKALASELLPSVIAAGIKFEVWSWAKPAGATRWEVKREEVRPTP